MIASQLALPPLLLFYSASAMTGWLPFCHGKWSATWHVTRREKKIGGILFTTLEKERTEFKIRTRCDVWGKIYDALHLAPVVGQSWVFTTKYSCIVCWNIHIIELAWIVDMFSLCLSLVIKKCRRQIKKKKSSVKIASIFVLQHFNEWLFLERRSKCFIFRITSTYTHIK